MKYFKLLGGDYPSFTLGKIYPEDSHGDTGAAKMQCIDYAIGGLGYQWEEVSLQDYARQELIKNLDLNNFAIVVRNSNAKEIVVYLESINVFPKGFYEGNSMDGSYYLKDNGKINCTTNNDSFKVTIYTLEEFKEAYKNLEKEQILAEVSGTVFEEIPLFEVPVKWCVKPKDTDEANKIFEFEPTGRHEDSRSTMYYQHFPPFKSRCTANHKINEGYTEITFEQFEKYVLNKQKNTEVEGISIEKLKRDQEYVVYIGSEKEWQQLNTLCGFKVTTHYCGAYCYSPTGRTYSDTSNKTSPGSYKNNIATLPSKVITLQQIKETMPDKKLIGYKLSGVVDSKTAAKTLGCLDTVDAKGLFFNENNLLSSTVQRAKELGILDIWFTPVYEERDLKVGDHIVFLEEFDGAPKGHIAVVNEIQKDSYQSAKGWVKYSPEVGDGGGFRWEGNGYYLNKDFRLATPEEIKAFNSKPNVSIRGYQSKVSKDSVVFGCQTYSKDFVLQLGKFLRDSDLKIEYQDEIEKVVKYFEKINV